MKKKETSRSISVGLCLIIIVLVSIGCKDIDTKDSDGNMPRLASESVKEIAGWPTPDSHTSGIPVYDSFEHLEPLFRIENDTTYVINFWATWCKPCIKELPYFEEIEQSHKNRKVKVVLVSLDFPKQLESKLVPFVEKRQLNSKVVVLLDGKYNNWIDKVSPQWSGAIPATYIYKGGQNKMVAAPFENAQELSEVLKPFL